MHISAAVKTPVVALFALTNPPEQWGPWRVAHRQLYHDVPCRICYQRVCPYQHECLRLVTPEMVVENAAELLRESSKTGILQAGNEKEISCAAARFITPSTLTTRRSSAINRAAAHRGRSRGG
jgi:hypothetical protein